MRKLLEIAVFIPLLGLTGCFESSDLIGKWQSEKIMGIQSVMQFKPDSMVVSSIAGDSETKIAGYVSEKGRLGVVVNQGEQKVTMWFDEIDHDTIRQTVGGIIHLDFHRVK